MARYLLFDPASVASPDFAAAIARESDGLLTVRGLNDPFVQNELDLARPGWKACSLFQQLSYCYRQGGGITDHWCSAWPETYTPLHSFDQYSGNPCTVTSGGKGYNLVRIETNAIFHATIPGIDWFPGISNDYTFRANQQADHDGGYSGWGDVIGTLA